MQCSEHFALQENKTLLSVIIKKFVHSTTGIMHLCIVQKQLDDKI